MLSDDNKKSGITIDSLGRLIGEELLNRLSIELGGRRIYISKNPGPNAPLVACIGIEAARSLASEFGGETFDVPTAIGRTAKIKALLDEGLEVAQIATRAKVSRRYVYQVWEKQIDQKRNKKQLDLFEGKT